MATDKVFYTMARLFPEAIPLLAGLEPAGGYRAESVTIKEQEFRLDCVLSPEDPGRPTIVIEFQGYREEAFFLRFQAAVALYCYQNEHFGPLLPLALFTKRAFIPVAPPPEWPALKVVCLEEIGEEEILRTRNPALIAMLPICAVPRKEVRARVGSWRDAIETNAPDEARAREAIALLAAFLGHRFPRRSLQELNGWLGGVPMEDTALGRDLIEIGRRTGLEQGLQQGLRQGLQQGERAMILSLAKRRFGRVTKRLERALARLDSPEKLLEAGEYLLDAESLPQFTKFVEDLAR